ncbi:MULTISPECIES: efflux RND transporter periplasmic adaptor subunit [unclassified Fusibacter]|uniref:efflux RND transporter periplasmic adaptor subunit n=1 Tax=unclassified Fusibacter TaxID=2624464 RepID=UPI001012B1D0|nr:MULTISPECIES: HlyD family efflux transporter periplasmic adaptor subunit [unclassified Fusibacter]MCK8059570.1 HlyD family efflux transporter periplasmic adaptor subunit [Fusibacter sp. A2]NPE21371.1 HlyD family efflux transporter periplasmic adaptor subunit [Fusibacter sp. A1]RXV61787.1 HlyD family efflux transporter periplasmic adaptor subunit [Fusibacter sp. A1]
MAKTGKKKKPWLWVVLAVVVVVVLFGGISAISGGSSAGQMVSGVKAAVEPIAYKIFANGGVESKQDVELIAEVSGRVLEVYVQEGDLVKIGDPILKLDDRQLTEQLEDLTLELAIAKETRKQMSPGGKLIEVQKETAALHYEQAKEDYERALKLFESGAYSQSQVDQANAAMQTAYQSKVSSVESSNQSKSSSDLVIQDLRIESIELRIDRLKDTIGKAVVISPIEGTVAKLNVKHLDNVQAGTSIVNIQDLESLKVKTYINQYDIGKIKVGQPVEITTNSAKGQQISGRIASISKVATVIQMGQGQEIVVPVVIDIDEKQDLLKINYSVRVEVTVEASENALVIPYETTRQLPDGSRVAYVIESGVLREVPLAIGIESDIKLEVLEGLIKEGETLLVNPDDSTVDGASVIVLGEDM